jgi:hypothetical protein
VDRRSPETDEMLYADLARERIGIREAA